MFNIFNTFLKNANLKNKSLARQDQLVGNIIYFNNQPDLCYGL